MSQIQDILHILQEKKEVPTKELEAIASRDNVTTYICKLRKTYHIRWLGGVYYFGGKKIVRD